MRDGDKLEAFRDRKPPPKQLIPDFFYNIARVVVKILLKIPRPHRNPGHHKLLPVSLLACPKINRNSPATF